MVYLQCKAGGISPDQHLSGEIKVFNVFMNGNDGSSFQLDRKYTWVKCNTDFKGFYVTDYSAQLFSVFENILLQDKNVQSVLCLYLLFTSLLNLIILTENKKLFSRGDRANLIHSAFALAYTGIQSYATAEYLTQWLQYNEDDYVPWRAFMWHITKVAALLEHRPAFLELKV